MWPILEQKLAHFRQLEDQLGDPVVAADHSRFTTVAKEHGSLAKLVKPYLEFKQLEESIRESEALLTAGDPEMAALAEEELAALRPQRDALHARLEDQLLID